MPQIPNRRTQGWQMVRNWMLMERPSFGHQQWCQSDQRGSEQQQGCEREWRHYGSGSGRRYRLPSQGLSASPMNANRCVASQLSENKTEIRGLFIVRQGSNMSTDSLKPAFGRPKPLWFGSWRRHRLRLTHCRGVFLLWRWRTITAGISLGAVMHHPIINCSSVCVRIELDIKFRCPRIPTSTVLSLPLFIISYTNEPIIILFLICFVFTLIVSTISYPASILYLSRECIGSIACPTRTGPYLANRNQRGMSPEWCSSFLVTCREKIGWTE